MSDFVRTSPGLKPDDANARGVDLVDGDAPAGRLLIRGTLRTVLEHNGRMWVKTDETHGGFGGRPIVVYRLQT